MPNPDADRKPSLDDLIAKGLAARKRLDAVIKEMEDLERQVDEAKKRVKKSDSKSKKS